MSALTKLKGSGKNTKGLCNLPNGKDYYAYLVSRDTGSPHTVEEIQKRIYAQISSDLIDIQTVAAKNPTLSLETSVTYDVPPSAIIQDLEQNITDAFPKPANVTTRIKYVPDALEPYLSPAFYMIPSIDNTSENVIYINQLILWKIFACLRHWHTKLSGTSLSDYLLCQYQSGPTPKSFKFQRLRGRLGDLR